MRILLIEDDPKTAAYIVNGLREKGQTIDLASDGWDGLIRATVGSFDVLIVDRMLPGMDGIALVKGARAAGVMSPVLILTALGSIEDRVAGLESGADDYLVKPFSLAELNARVNALARRPPVVEHVTELKVGDLVLDRLGRVVKRSDQLIELKPREFRLLEELMLHADRIVTRAMLLDRVWNLQFDPGTNIVETHISRLRAKIDLGDQPALIHTMRGEGYVIRAF